MLGSEDCWSLPWWQPINLDNSGEGGHQAKASLVGCGCGYGEHQSKTLGVGRVQVGYGDGLKEVVVNHYSGRGLAKQDLTKAVISTGGKLLTRDIVDWWKELYQELLNPTNLSSVAEAEVEDSGEALPITLVDLSEVIKKLFSSKVPVVDDTERR